MHQFYPIPRLLLIAMLVFTASSVNADDYDARYFQGLRQRGLHTLAAGVLTRQLKDSTLTERERQERVLELSMTYADHASTKFDDADALWEQAIGVIDTFLETTVSEQIHAECKVQRGVIMTLQGIHHYRLSELLGSDAQHQNRATKTLGEAIKSLTTSQISLNELLERFRATRLSTARLRGLLDQTSYQLANAHVHQAILKNDNLVEKSNALLQAMRLLTPLVDGSPDEAITSQSQVLFARALRIKRDGKRLDFFVEKLAKGNPLPQVIDGLVAEQVQLLLDSNKPTEAATKLLERRREVRRLSDELVFLQVQTLLQMRSIASAKKNSALADDLFAQAERIVNDLVSRSSGYWSTLAKLTLQRAQNSANLGPKLAKLVSAAKSAYRNNKLEEAAKLYQQAFDQALVERQKTLSFEFGMAAGELFLQQKQLNEAIKVYTKVEQHSASASNAAQAHLMRCYIQSQIGPDDTTLLKSLLKEHITKYGEQPTVGEVYWMQGNMFAREKHYYDAIARFLKISMTHQRATIAVREAARCCLMLKPTGKNKIDAELARSIDAVAERISELSLQFPDGNADLIHAELAIIDLQMNDQTSSRAQIDRRLTEIATSVSDRLKSNLDPKELKNWQAANGQTTTLLIMNHVLAGQTQKAEGLLRTALQQKTVDSLRLLEAMKNTVINDRQQNYAIGKMMLAIATAVQQSNRKLTASEEKLVTQSILDGYLRQGDLDKAIRSLEQELRASPKDVQLQIRVAKLMQASGLPKHLERAIPIWRKLETTAKPGSEDWYEFRLSYAETLIAQGRQNQCRKLVAITKALYPKVPTKELKDRLAKISAQLN